jgi:hypothetical protein
MSASENSPPVGPFLFKECGVLVRVIELEIDVVLLSTNTVAEATSSLLHKNLGHYANHSGWFLYDVYGKHLLRSDGTPLDPAKTLAEIQTFWNGELGHAFVFGPRQSSGLFCGKRLLPLDGVHVSARILDSVAEVQVVQFWANDTDELIDGRYELPLDEAASICGFEAELDDRTLVGKVKEKEVIRA